RPTRSTRKRGKALEEEEEREAEKRTSSRSTRKEKEVVESEDGEKEEPKKGKRTASRSARKGKKGVETEVEEEEEEEETVKEKRPATRSTRKGRKAAEPEEEEEEGGEEAERNRRGATTRSTRKGKRAVDENEEEEEEERESPKKRARVTVAEREDKEEGTTRSRARRRIILDGEIEGEKEEEKGVKRGKGKKDLQPIETPKKKREKEAEEKKKERTAKGAEKDDDIEILDEYVNVKEEENDFDVSSDNEITVVGTKGVPAASDVNNYDKQIMAECESICRNIRNCLRSVFMTKDDRAFKNAVQTLAKTQSKAYEREDDYEETAGAYYDEIEHQLVLMMMKEDGEKKAETEGKQRVLKAIAKASVVDFEMISDDQYDSYWVRIDYLLKKFATAEDPFIRANFCFWVSSILHFSKECHQELFGKRSKEELDKEHQKKLAERKVDGEDEDRRLIDGHRLKLPERKRLYNALYTSLKHDDPPVRMAAIRGLSVIQDDPIPPNFSEAIKHSPKDLVMRQLMDVHVNVRKTAIEELRPTTDQQIEFLLNAAMQEKHENVRILAFTQLGRLKIGQFNRTQRHALLAMLNDNRLGRTIEHKLLHSWLYEMVTGENPKPIIIATEGHKKKGKRKNNDKETKDKWASASLRLLRYLDCVDYSDEILKVLRKAAPIARKESGYDKEAISRWISIVIEECEKEEMGQITMTEYKHLLDRDSFTDESRATVLTFWLHCLQFVRENSRDDGDRYDGVNQLSPSMGDLRQLIMDLLVDERERRAPRKKMMESGEIDDTHPACISTSSQLQSVVTMLLRGFKYLQHGDPDAMSEWRSLLMDLSSGNLCDVSSPMWEVIMRQLLEFHTKEAERDDLIYEVAHGMGFIFDDAVEEKTEANSPRRHSLKGAMVNGETPKTSNERKEREEKRREDRRLVLSRPDCLGMISGALKTGYFKATAESLGIVFKAEMDAYRLVCDNQLQAVCLECIGMFGLFSSEMAERYIGIVMENLTKPPPLDDEKMEEEVREEEVKKRRKKLDRIIQDDLEIQYERREKEERERKEAEMRRKRGGRNHCVGLAVAVMSDLIVAHSLSEVLKWLSSWRDNYTAIDLFGYIERLALEQDLDLVFMVANATCKLALHGKECMRYLSKTLATLQFRVLHPSSFSHSKYRACICSFFPYFGSKRKLNQFALAEVVVAMLSMLKDRSRTYKNIIDRGDNSSRAIFVVVFSFAPSSLPKPVEGDRNTTTAHGGLLRTLCNYMEECREEVKEEIPIDMEYYKAMLMSVLGLELSGQSATVLRNLLDVVFHNMEQLRGWDKGNEAKKLAVKVLNKLEGALDTVNEIMRLNKALGVTVNDTETLVPFDDEKEKKMDELRKKVREMGVDLREISPVNDNRPGRGLKTPMTKRRGGNIDRRGQLSTLKKEPARSKSYAATAAAERKEAAAAAASATANSPTTPLRASTRVRQRPAKMPTIDESSIEESDSD
ncbi:hypothetical protein PENTCL1PPCAC_1919, partial [Pristionchus entomophagus]